MSDMGSADGNALVPAAAEAASPSAPSSGPAGAQMLNMPGASQAGDVLKYMKAQMDQSAAHVGKLKEAEGRATVIRQALDKLTALGDTVTPEDVTKQSSKLVAAGMGAEEVAGLLADMPTGPEALQGWVAQHDQALRANEAQLGQALAVARHQLGVQALHHIGAVGMVNHGLQQASPMTAPLAGPSNNPLTGAI